MADDKQLKQFQNLHNQIISIIAFSINKGISLANIILVLELIKSDLINQRSKQIYSGRIEIKEKHGRIQKDTP